MIRQCFFPTSYRRRSKNYFKPTPEPDSIYGNSFVKRLDLSCRRPVYSERNKNSYTQNQNETFTEGDTVQLKRYCQLGSKMRPKRAKLSEQKILASKLMLHPQKKQIASIKQFKRRTMNQFGSGNKGRRFGITEIKNQDLSWKNQKTKINMTQRLKRKVEKQSENVIMGWDYYEDTDNFF